ncbi:MAG: DNA repair protein RecO [Caloramator sp.]|nr:DNA repair protein RecO [Caloramator sp.]
MSIHKVQGVVLKTCNYSEYDKIITIFSDKYGKIDILCNGARRTKSKQLHLTQQFCFGEYVLSKSKDMYVLNSGSLNNSFQSLLNDYKKLMLGSYFLEFIDKSIENENKNVYVLALLLKTLYLLEDGTIDNYLLKVTFDFKLVSLLGYTPQVLKCIKCGKKTLDEAFFSIIEGGLICKSCNNNVSYIRINNKELEILTKIRNIKLEDLGKIYYDKTNLKFIDELLQQYTNYYLSLKLNTIDFIKNIF